jgi:hypothetical protein
MNSRTSRPRSPTSATTAVSNASAAANIASSVDLPTPEPAKTPMRWPKQSGVKISMTRTPVLKGASTRCRVMALTASDGGGAAPWIIGGPRSIGWPSALTIRPRQLASGAITSGPRLKTGMSTPRSAVVSNGDTSTSSGVMRTISPRRRPRSPSCSTTSPMQAWRDRPLTV